MASLSNKVFLLLIFFSSFQLLTVFSVEFQVGDDKGWVLPNTKEDDQLYNHWASKNRFKVNDTVRFKYKKDSVLVVSDAEYDKCRSSHPLFFSNNGDTIFKFEYPGLYYFISGIAGHCDRGQKMIIKVLEMERPPPPSPEDQNGTSDSSQNSGAVEMDTISFIAIIVFSVSFLGFAFN